MRRWLLPTVFLFASCSSASEDNPVVLEVEASLETLTRDTATLVRQPGPDLFVEAHSDASGYRRIRVVEAGALRQSSATAWYDDRSRQRVVDASVVGLNPGEMMDGEEIEQIAEMVFGERPMVGQVEPDGVVEATSLLGEPLYRPNVSGDALEALTANLEAALADRDANPNDPDAWIWVGRRLAYLGRYGEAIDVYAEGIDRWPEDPRFLRHRGHRYLTTRRIEAAEADFAAAWALIEASGSPDEVEPDGQPNARGIPVSTLHSNVRYHLALSRYLQGDFEGAAEAWGADVEASVNPDMLVASSYWLWLSLRRLGRDEAAAAVLAPITEEMDIIENTSYHRLLMLFSGELEESDLLAPGEDPLQNTTTAYGVAAWHLVEGRIARAAEMFEGIVAGEGPWAAFGYIAAEAEVAR